MGTPTLLKLIDEEYNIRVFEKPASKERVYQRKLKRFYKILEEYRDRIEVHWGDISNHLDVEKAMEGVDAVIHLAAVIPPLSEMKPDLAVTVNIEGTRNIVKAMEKFNVRRLIYSSSVAVYGDRRSNPWIKRTDPVTLNPPDTYTRTKIECERIIEDSDLDWTIFRLGAVFIKSFNIDLTTVKTALIMPLDTSLEWISAEDCAQALVESLKHPELIKQKYNLGGGSTCRVVFKDFLNRILPLLGYPTDLLPVEAFNAGNSHGGFFDDEESKRLAEILKHQNTTLEEYYQSIKESVNPFRRHVRRLYTTLMKPILQRYLKTKLT